MAGFVLPQIDAAINLFTSLLAHGARSPRYKSNLQWLLNLRTRALSKVSEKSGAQKDGQAVQREADSGGQTQSDNRHDENDEDVELLGWRTRLIERAGQGGRRKVIRTIHFAGTPTDSQTTETGNMPLHDNRSHGQLGALDPAIAATALPSVTMDSTNDVVSSNIALRSSDYTFGLTSTSFATSGTRCSSKTYLDLKTTSYM